MAFESHDDDGDVVHVAVRDGLVLGRMATPHLRQNVKVSRVGLFVERVDAVRGQAHIVAMQTQRNVAVIRDGAVVADLPTATRFTLRLGDDVALIPDLRHVPHAPHVFRFVALADTDANATSAAVTDDEPPPHAARCNDHVDEHDVHDEHDEHDDDVADDDLHDKKRRRTSSTLLPSLPAASVPVPASMPVSVPVSVPAPRENRSRSANNASDDDDVSLVLDDRLRDALRSASFATLTFDADADDEFAPSFVASLDHADSSTTLVRAPPLPHVDNEQVLLCGRRVLLTGSFGQVRALLGGAASGDRNMVTLAVDCACCGAKWCGHVSRMLQRLALNQVSAAVTPAALDFLVGRPRRRRKTPQLSTPALQAIFDQIFGAYDETVDDAQLDEVARFLDGQRQASAAVRRIGPIELNYASGGWRRVGTGDDSLVLNNGPDIADRFTVTQAFARGSSAFYVMHRNSDQHVVRCAVAHALGPSGVFSFRCECRASALCEHVCRVLALTQVPEPIDIGELLCSLASMSLTEQSGLAARLIMRAKMLSIDRLLAAPFSRLAKTTVTLSMNTAALPAWSVAVPGTMPPVLIASQGAPPNDDILVSTLTQSYSAVALRLRGHRLVASHCDSSECATQPCEHAFKTFRDFSFYARGGFGGVAIHATTTVGGAAQQHASNAPALLSYAEIEVAMRALAVPERCTRLAMALRDAQQIRSSIITKRFAQLWANVVEVDGTYPVRPIVETALAGAVMSIDEAESLLMRAQVVLALPAYVDTLCVVTLLHPQREYEQRWRLLWREAITRADAGVIHQCMHAGRTLAPRPLGALIVTATLSRIAARSHVMIDADARRSFFLALCAPPSHDSSEAVERAAQNLFAVPPDVRQRLPFRLVPLLAQRDPITEDRAGVKPLLESAMFLLPPSRINVLQNASRQELNALPVPTSAERVLSSNLSLADCAALADARGLILAPQYLKQDYKALIDQWRDDGGALPVLLLCDAALRHPLVHSPFVESLLCELFAQLMAQMHFVVDGALSNVADFGALRVVAPLASLALNAMAVSMTDVQHYSGSEVAAILLATPDPLRKSLALRLVIQRLAQCPFGVLRSCFTPMCEWLGAMQLHAHRWQLCGVAMRRLLGEREEGSFAAQVTQFAMDALRRAYRADGRNAISRALLRDACNLYGACVLDVAREIGQLAMLIEHLLQTPRRWSELELAVAVDDSEARVALLDPAVQRCLYDLRVTAHAGATPPAAFLTRVCDLLPDNSSSCALLLVRAPNATDSQRRAAVGVLLMQTIDDDVVFEQLRDLSRESFVLLSQARVCEQMGRAKLAAQLLFGVFEDQTGISESVQMQFEHEVLALFEKLLARDDVDLLDMLAEPRAKKLLSWVVGQRSTMLIEAHSRSTSGARRSFAVECFNCAAELVEALVRQACRNQRCSSCVHCQRVIDGVQQTLVWAHIADRIWEFDRRRSATSNALKASGKPKLMTAVNNIRNDVELTAEV